MIGTILIADDEKNIRETLRQYFDKAGHNVLEAEDGEDALRCLRTHDVDCLITDLQMPRMDGMRLLSKVKSVSPETVVVMITAYGTVDKAVEAMKQGAFDFITKPCDIDELGVIINKALAQRAALEQEPSVGANEFEGMVAQSRSMNDIFEVIRRVGASDANVLITGESGTGKELVARAVHAQSSRKGNPFIAMNCAALPENLLESEMFGHEKGAFTGAIVQRPGRFELAHGGTLFLDEIGEVPLNLQTKFLRVLQEQNFERVGGVKKICTDCRVIAATNRDLVRAVKDGQFREDLFYRLNVVPVCIPPLRERREDIPLLVKYILSKKSQGKIDIDQEAVCVLERYDWPGNIRELENILERIVVMARGTRISVIDIPREITCGVPKDKLDEVPSYDGTFLKDIVKDRLSKIEKNIILDVLEKTGSNISRSARMLGITRATMQNKMRDYGLR